jgi:uncharacterized membrane protein (DUF4010 family)
MARASRTGADVASALAGAQIASAATYVELGIIVTLVSGPLAARLAAPAVVGALACAGVSLVVSRGSRPSEVPAARERVVTLAPALVLAAILTGALFVARWGAQAFGARGAVLAVAAAGLADAHGGSLTAATLFTKGALSLDASLVAVGAAMTTNTIVKCAVAFAVGGRSFGRRFSVGVGGSHLLFLATLALVMVLW